MPIYVGSTQVTKMYLGSTAITAKYNGVDLITGGGVIVPPTPISISGTPGPATVGTLYSFVPSTANGSGTKSFTLGGTLPTGLSFSSVTGAVTGTPTVAGTSNFSISVTDLTGTANLNGLSIVVAAVGQTLLPLTTRLAFAENSYGAQGANVDYVVYALNRLGWKGAQTIGTKQARGGDRLTHLHDRIAPVTSQRSPIPIIMNPENDYASLASDSTANGDVLKSRLDTVLTDISSAYTGARPIVRLSANTNGANGKPLAAARYRSLVQAQSGIDIFDDALYFNAQDATQSSDGIHPNTYKSAKALGDAWGDFLKTKFVTDKPFDAGPTIAGNITAFNPATAWTITTNTSGLTVSSQTQGTLRTDPSRPSRNFIITGTNTSDPTLNTTVPDLRLRLTMPISPARTTYGMIIAALMKLEVTNSSGGDPIGLATLSLTNGNGTTFSKQLVTSNGTDQWDKLYQDVIGILPAMVTGQTSNLTFDITLRGKLNVATDIEIRIADINNYVTDDVAYGPAKSMSSAFTFNDGTNRPPLYALPTTTPATGSTITVPGTLALNRAGTFVGGGISYVYDVLRNNTTVVGTVTPISQSAAATTYATTNADAGTNTLGLRQTGTNTFEGTTYSDTSFSGLVSVNP